MIFSGVIMSAPFAVAPPLNICSTIPKTETFYRALRFFRLRKGDFNLALHWKECYTWYAKTNRCIFDRIQEIAKEDGT